MKSLIITAATFAFTGAAMAQSTQPVTPSAGLFNSLHAVISNPDAAQHRRRSPPPAPQPAPPPSSSTPSTAGPAAPGR